MANPRDRVDQEQCPGDVGVNADDYSGEDRTGLDILIRKTLL